MTEQLPGKEIPVPRVSISNKEDSEKLFYLINTQTSAAMYIRLSMGARLITTARHAIPNADTHHESTSLSFVSRRPSSSPIGLLVTWCLAWRREKGGRGRGGGGKILLPSPASVDSTTSVAPAVPTPFTATAVVALTVVSETVVICCHV